MSKVIPIYASSPETGTIKGLVTGYSALGTGFFTEISSTFTDFFGKQSQAYREKLQLSEDAAKQDLIVKAIEMSTDAIYDVKFQITEATSGKGILIVYFFIFCYHTNNLTFFCD